MTPLSRRVLLGSVGVSALAACGPDSSPAAVPSAPASSAPPLTPGPGQTVREFALTPQVSTIDLGGTTVRTWSYDGSVPGPTLRATAGDLIRVTVDNRLPEPTTVHWHGVRLRNVADGIPGVTQEPIAAGARYLYEFVAPDPGTYWLHSHVGLQLDRGLYAPLVIDDPAEPGDYDGEWVVVLDDWIDGSGSTPDEVYAGLTADGGGAHGGHGMGGMMTDPPWGPGDVTYPHHLVNGRLPQDPSAFHGRPGQRVRIRLVNAAADTIYTVGLAGHRMTVTHTDGWPVQPRECEALFIGMGERYDVTVTLQGGSSWLVALPFAKQGEARGLVTAGRSGARGSATREPDADWDAAPLVGSTLNPAESSLLPGRASDTVLPLTLTGGMSSYTWGINGAPHGHNQPLVMTEGQRVGFAIRNMTGMTHPVHIHGHTFALPGGLRKDTLLVPPMGGQTIELDADNVGRWMVHCHNAYHLEAGMMIGLDYA